jgi:hypothetical protein
MAKWTKYLIPTQVISGQVNVTTAGTAVALGTTNDIISVVIKAKSSNTGNIYVGGSNVSSSNGLILSAGDAVSLDINNLSSVYIDSDVNGEGVSYLALK